MLAEAPERGRLAHGQLVALVGVALVGVALVGVALVGVAPFNRESGTRRGRRTVWGAAQRAQRAQRALHGDAARHPTRCNPLIQTYYARLLAAGKAKQVAWVACMHKLLTIVNALLKHHTAWPAQAA